MPFRPLAVIVAAALAATAGLWPGPARAAEPDLDVEYARAQPLAVESLLLDITRTADGRFVAVGERGHVIHSDDGEAWTQAEHVPTRSTLTTVTAAAGRLWAAGHDTVILTSADGGVSWTLLNRDIERRQPVMDIHFFDGERGLAIGAYGLALFTADGGVSWEERVVSPDEWHLNAVLDRGAGRLLIAGEAGHSWLSADGGETWEVVDMPYPGSMFGVVREDACVLEFGLRGHLQRSCDGADAWMPVDTGSSATLIAGAANGGELLLVGNSGTILRRSRGGEFSEHRHSSGVDFSGVVAAGDGRWLLSGEDGVHRFPETPPARRTDDAPVAEDQRP